MLEQIKLILGLTDSSKDALLNLLIMQCHEEAMAYTRNDCIDALIPAINQMVIYRYSQLGAEGLSSESYSGVNFNYLTDYPETILRMLKSHRKLALA